MFYALHRLALRGWRTSALHRALTFSLPSLIGVRGARLLNFQGGVMLCAQEGCLAKAVIVTACVLCSRFRSPREAEKMHLNKLLALMAFTCWSTPCTSAAAQTQCVSFSDSIDGVNKDRTVEKSLKSLDAQIEKWKADNGVTGPVTVTAEKPEPH